MAKLPITLACWAYDRTRPLMDGRVQVEGVDLNYLDLEPPEHFFRMLRYGDFEASEMSMAWYTGSLFDENRRFIAIPAFPSRSFRHSGIYVHRDSGIHDPADLVGHRIGVPEFQQTAGVWIRGILADRYGVDPRSVDYFQGGLVTPGRRESAQRVPTGMNITEIPGDTTLSQLLESGELDAVYSAHAPATFTAGSPNVRRLFPDFEQHERKYLADTGIFPIMHTIVVRVDVLATHPWVAASLYKALDQAKNIAREELLEPAAMKVMLPWAVSHAQEMSTLFGTADFWPYGLEPNRLAVTTFLRYSFEQGLIPRQPEPEELFYPSTLEIAKT